MNKIAKKVLPKITLPKSLLFTEKPKIVMIIPPINDIKNKSINGTKITIKENRKNAHKKDHIFGAKLRLTSRTVSGRLANSPNTNLPIIALLTIDFAVQKANNNNQTAINNKKLERLPC
ncbi:hypothetical protein CYANOKiyG1_04730 [Okeania sp. KiyG1]|nr:hypothetical protein CYANOKiyG1_04730 [Okeania sp. KiyG1]